MLGLAAVVALPATIAFAQVSPRLTLLQAGFATPVAAVLGLGAVLAARAARRRAQWSISGSGGGWTARSGRVLGLVALLVARAARRRTEWSIAAAGGGWAARAGRLLGLLALCLAASGAIAVGFYELLVRAQ